MSEPVRGHADEATVNYFDSHAHHYSNQRIKGVADLISHRVTPDSSLCDVGAGGGETLKRLAKELRLKQRNLTAMDVSAASLARAQERMPRCSTTLVSILDDEGLKPYQGGYDAVLVAAVLHHLVGPTRSASFEDAQHGLRNAFRLARPGGIVIVLEPVFQPRAASSGLFWVKRATTSVTDERLPVFGYWNNVGAPLVSFYTSGQVRSMVAASGGRIVAEHSAAERVGWGARLMKKDNLTVVAERVVEGPPPNPNRRTE